MGRNQSSTSLPLARLTGSDKKRAEWDLDKDPGLCERGDKIHGR